MADEPRVAIVVPWRAGDPRRERAWTWCRTWWEQFGWPIFEVEHPPPEPFNRSWCINEGARRAWPWDILVAIDADVFEGDPQQVRDGVASAWETGRLTIPHTVGTDLNERGTSLLITERPGWERMVHRRRPVCTSRVWVMREDLFETVGGFDERFRGWGHEDVAAFHSMRTLRGCDQLPGTAWHLYHERSFPTAKRTPEWDAGHRLVERYLAADRQGWPEIAPILAERKVDERWDRPTVDAPPPRQRAVPPPSGRPVDVVCLTAGRQEYLEQTLASFAEQVRGTIATRTLIDDSGDRVFGAWLAERYPDWTIHTTRGRMGFTRAIRAAWTFLQRRRNAPHIFHLEEDFTFDREVDLEDMIEVLEQDKSLAQCALLRGPFYPPEIDAGGIIEQDPDAYTRRTDRGPAHLVHQKFFTTNPCVYRRDLLRVGWPNVENSERVFTRQMVRRGFSFALLGDGTPMVSHIGHVRTMRGY